MSAVRTYTIRIHRFTKGVVDPPRYENFVVDAEPDESVLDALERLRLEQDRSLVYRRSCHHGSCGTCGCRIDGVERLACVTQLGELDAEGITVEPLQGFECEGDLVVDVTPLFRDLPTTWSTLRPTEISGDEISRTRLEDCIECGLCVSACPAAGGDSTFLGPAMLSALHRQLEKAPHEEAELLALAASDRGTKSCQRSIDCSRRCPTGVAPARHIAVLRRLVESSAS